MYEVFRGEVAKEKKIRKLTNSDLAEMTGIKESSLKAFMCGARDSERTARAIAKALDIEL